MLVKDFLEINDDVINYYYKTYCQDRNEDLKLVREKLTKMVSQIKEMKGKPNENRIKALKVFEVDEDGVHAYYDVSLDVKEEDEYEGNYSCMGLRWDEIVFAEMFEASLLAYSAHEVIAEVLYELSWFGFDEKEYEYNRKEFIKELNESHDDIENGNIVDFDELMKEIGEDVGFEWKKPTEEERGLMRARAEESMRLTKLEEKRVFGLLGG